jgi:putative transposase
VANPVRTLARWRAAAGRPGKQKTEDRAADDAAKTEVLAFTAFPRAHWQKIWSTNPLERVNKEIKRRARVVGIFPHPASVIRLVGAVLADMHNEWQAGDRRYLSEGSMALL